MSEVPCPADFGQAGSFLTRQRIGESYLSFFMSYYVYIIRSLKDNRYYIGSTSDLAGRLAYHNSGRQRSTRHRIPFELVYSEEYPDQGSALRRERQIKSYKGGDAFRKLINGV